MKLKILIILLSLITATSVFADNKVTEEKAAALAIIKFVVFDARFKDRGSDLQIHVAGDKKLADTLQSLKSAKLPSFSVTQSSELPTKTPDFMIVGDVKDIKKFLSYTANNKVLSVTRASSNFDAGVSVGAIRKDKRISIKLNVGQSIKEGSNWQFDFSKLNKVNLEFSSD